ncbi:hypothetical protein LguiA_018504 [Lonicera macranthoides]
MKTKIARLKMSENWINHGGDIYNRSFASKETKITPSTVSNLTLKWSFYAGKDISATPEIYEGTIYFPSWNGYIYAVKAEDGSFVWKKELQELTRLNFTGRLLNVTAAVVSRSTPTVNAEMVIVGISSPAVVIAVKRKTGELIWSTNVDSHRFAVITMSGTYHNGEYAGAAIWGSSPSIDVQRNLIFIASGNLYSIPLHVRRCQESENRQTVPSHPDQCVELENLSQSIIAMDLESGEIKWYKHIGGYDIWFFACDDDLKNPNCPLGPYPYADFGEAPMMLSVRINGMKRDVVVAVQKSGFAWALDRENGKILWSTRDLLEEVHGEQPQTRRGYTPILPANSDGQDFTLAPSNTTTTGGGWVAMNARTGQTLWSTTDPNNDQANGPLTVANGVVFAGSTYKTGPIYAIDAITGKILWSNVTGATVFGGISVSDGCIYVGSGYKVAFGVVTPSFSGGTSLFAFCV